MRVPSTQSTSIAVHDLGGDGPALLVCHATGFCGGAYRPLAAELAPHHRVFAVDMRGHGESTPPADGDFAWSGMADDVAATAAAIAEVAPGPLHVVGHSMGGAAALLAEHRRPGTFASAYLYEPIVPPRTAPDDASVGNPLAQGARFRQEVFPSRAEALWRYAARTPLGILRADALAAYAEHGFEDVEDGKVRLRCRREHEALTFEGAGAVHAGLFGDLALRTTVAVGGTDPGMVADFAPALAAVLPHATLEPHPTLGHFGPLQDPVTVAAAIVVHTTAG
ncbi:MAG TPA: alpha/beta fold hydrolase [Iamia sp.]|nr:alpha/beta fold hydrolase [Iamia sp.]